MLRSYTAILVSYRRLGSTATKTACLLSGRRTFLELWYRDYVAVGTFTILSLAMTTFLDSQTVVDWELCAYFTNPIERTLIWWNSVKQPSIARSFWLDECRRVVNSVIRHRRLNELQYFSIFYALCFCKSIVKFSF